METRWIYPKKRGGTRKQNFGRLNRMQERQRTSKNNGNKVTEDAELRTYSELKRMASNREEWKEYGSRML